MNLKPNQKLDQVGIRRLLLFIQKQFHNAVRNMLAQGETHEWLEYQLNSIMLEIAGPHGFWRGGYCDYELTVDKTGVLLGIQPRPWVEWVEMEMKWNIS